DHLEITCDSTFVASDGKVQGVLCRHDGFILDFSFVFQNSHRREIVFHLLESIQDALSIVSDLRVISRTRLVGERTSSSYVKYGANGRQPERPDATGTIQQGGDAGALKSSGSTQIDGRVVGRLRDSDLGVGRG